MTASTGRARAGVTLVECLVALTLAGIVSAAVASVLGAQGRVLRLLTAHASDADAYRITAGVLRSELRLLSGNDVRAVAGDSIAVRLYRGFGAVCAQAGDRLLVQYAGDRLPAPDKDSVVTRVAAGESVHALKSVEPTTCDGRSVLALRLASAPAPAAMVLIFESGTYFLRDHALRYRLGAAGRQPITDERFAPSGPAIALDSLRVLVPLAWRAGTPRPVDTLRIHFANVPE